MIDACSSPADPASVGSELPCSTGVRPAPLTGVCPSCRHSGKPVPRQTVKSLLAVSLRSVAEADYHFCRTRRCPVVYFASAAGAPYTTADIRERVYQKEPERHDVFVCYCFRHTVSELREASAAAASRLMRDITDGIQAGQCACELRNPQGSCCLGNVRASIKQLTRPGTERTTEQV